MNNEFVSEIESNFSNSMNKLKGKIFNLVDVLNLEKEQKKSFIDLIKGFANDEYHTFVGNLRYEAMNKGLIEDMNDVPPIIAEPLDRVE